MEGFMYTPRTFTSPRESDYSYAIGKYQFELPNQKQIEVYCDQDMTADGLQQQIFSYIQHYIKNNEWQRQGHKIPVPESFCQIAIPQLKIVPRVKPISEILEILSHENSSLDDAYVVNDQLFSTYHPLLNTVYHVNIAVPNPHASIQFLEEHQQQIASNHVRKISEQLEDIKASTTEAITYIAPSDAIEATSAKSAKESSRCLVM